MSNKEDWTLRTLYEQAAQVKDSWGCAILMFAALAAVFIVVASVISVFS